MQLCLSVPLPFAANTTGVDGEPVPQRHLYAAPLVNATLNVHPIQLLYMGRYSAVPAALSNAGAAVVRLAEGTRDVVLPLTGDGIRPDMTVFLTPQLCHGVPIGSNGSNESDRAHQPRIFVALKRSDLPSKSAARRLFDSSTATPGEGRTPLNVCLYAPRTATLVSSTSFQLVVEPPRVTSIRNLPSDTPLLARATAHMPPYGKSSSSSPELPSSVATVVYASNMDLSVEGFGLDDANTWLVPAVDCGNVSSYLWRTGVPLSSLPSSTTTTVRIAIARGSATNPLYAASTRYVDPQTFYSSWFLSLRQAETARVGASANVISGTYVDRFQRCVHMAVKGEDVAVSPYVPTGLPYRSVISAADGFVLESSSKHDNHIATVLALPTQHDTKGRRFPMKLAGPIFNVVQAIGSPLYMFLAPQELSCYAVKNGYMHQGLHALGNAFFSSVNGSAVLLPRWLAAPGICKLCASALHPALASADGSMEATLPFFTLDGLQVQLTKAVYSVFTLNHTTSVTVEQGEEWTLPVLGSLLTSRSLVRFRPVESQCSEPMVAAESSGGAKLPDIRVHDAFAGFSLFGGKDDDGDSEDTIITNGHYVVLSQSFLRSLAAPATYVLYFQPQNHLDWRVAPDISLIVKPHVRRPKAYRSFPRDGREDVALLTALAPSKVALEWNTSEKHTVNIVGSVYRQISLAM
ncbi:hypothetical protein CUR178_07935 [Leishmania enriettii]|uniref:Uncharacterized protein n=1 Tax=Leishmania enriettii TaxID=5663 RepID=A0A836I1Z7_LEIEN|nr:hypothetical protein CUR178_07935 [Leishmania enriettii]